MKKIIAKKDRKMVYDNKGEETSKMFQGDPNDCG
jgi:hypothetical protein